MKAVADNHVNFAANHFDHRYNGKNLDSDDIEKALNYLRENDPDLVPEAMKFMSMLPPYKEELFDSPYKEADPVSWWKSVEKLGFDKNLVAAAVSLVTAISSSGGIERCFSTLGITYGSLTHSLDVEKAGKLAFLFRQLNQK